MYCCTKYCTQSAATVRLKSQKNYPLNPTQKTSQQCWLACCLCNYFSDKQHISFCTVLHLLYLDDATLCQGCFPSISAMREQESLHLFPHLPSFPAMSISLPLPSSTLPFHFRNIHSFSHNELSFFSGWEEQRMHGRVALPQLQLTAAPSSSPLLIPTWEHSRELE